MVREQVGVTKTALIAVIAGLGLVAAVSIMIARAGLGDRGNPKDARPADAAVTLAPTPANTPTAATAPHLPGSPIDFDQDTAANILLAIRSLESDRDPKCHSTACRFEDFIYGTPLTGAARDRKVDLQKELILGLWTVATSAAAEAGDRTLSRRRLQPFIDAVATIAEDDDGTILVRCPGADPVEISPVRRRQFATIAYSLRAILAVGQDAAMRGTPLAPLDDDATAALNELVDAITLCALKLADQAARRVSVPQVSPALLVDAWRGLVPPAAITPGPVQMAVSNADAARAGREVLFSMIDNKVSAYRVYNNVDAEAVIRRFADNIQTYYARFRLPSPDGPHLPWLMQAYRARLLVFVRELVTASQRLASEHGHEFIRASDALAVTGQLLPRRIDDFEDLHYFDRLGPDDRVTLESYDCDSFRDTGLHWLTLKSLYRDSPDIGTLPDPFAAEILTEAASEYGVLLFRVAGRIATAQDDPMMVLTPRHIAAAGDEIAALASRHHAASGQPETAPAIVSATPAGADETGALFFTDVTIPSGVRFEHRSTGWIGRFRRTAKLPPTFSGGGVASEDIDGDGHPDLLFVGGGGNALLRNDGHGRFEDVTDRAGIVFLRPDGTHGEGRHPLICDLDNDGRPDIFIAYANDDHRLYRNLGAMTFEDVTDRAGLGGRGLICGPVTIFDYDNDGLLDIYITYFGDYLNGALPAVERDSRNALPNKLFRNLGDMRFEDVTAGSGTGDTGWAQGVTHTDFDRDGLQDIVVANDFGRNVLLRNLGGGRFENIASALGITYAYHSMNVGITDLNRDSFPDLYVSNIATMVKDDMYAFPDAVTTQHFTANAMATLLFKEANVLYMSVSADGRLTGYTPSTDIERGESTTGWAWGAEFFDFDNDGDDDLYVVNGANDYFLYWSNMSLSKGGETTYTRHDWGNDPNVFFVNDGGRLLNRSRASGADFEGNSRSTAYLDWDGDGDLDIAVNNFHGPAVMLRNNAERRGNNWVRVRLVGDPARGVNLDAIGARFVATTDDGLYLLREVQGGSGYMSMNPKRQHIGLGRADTVDLHITWPDGRQQTVEALAANHSYEIRPGEQPTEAR